MKLPNFISVKDLSKLIKKKEVSPVEILENYLIKINILDKQFNTFAYLDIKRSKNSCSRV